MAIEKRWAAIAPVAFTATGTSKGKVSVTSTRGFRVKMDVVLVHPTLPSLELEVKQVVGPTTLYLGPKNTRINEFSDLTAYDSQTSIYANEQSRPSIPIQEFERATYEEEPVVAKRVHQVDEFGDSYTAQNPLPVQLSDGSINIDTINAQLQVHLTHQDSGADPHDSVRIGDGVEELEINSNKEALVHDQDAHDGLQILTQTLQSEFDQTQILLQSEFDQTQAKQDTGNSSLASIDSKIDNTPLGEVTVADVPNQTGLNSVLNLTTTAIEGKVGATTLFDRKYIEMQALTTNVKWGYDLSCPFDLFKGQFFALPSGTNCKVYFKAATGTAQVAFAEK